MGVQNLPRIGMDPIVDAGETSHEAVKPGFAGRTTPAAAPEVDDFMADLDSGEGDAARPAEPPEEAYPIIVGPRNERVSHIPATQPARSAGWVQRIMSFRLLSLLLLAALAVASWKAYALATERQALARELRAEAGARRQALMSARDAEARLAGAERELADARQGTQELRLAALKREAAAAVVPPPKPAAPACATPHSVLVLRGRGL